MSAVEQRILLDTCPLCHGTGRRELARFDELTWVQCQCGLIYKLSERPREPNETFYSEDYFTQSPYVARLGRRIRKSRRQILDALNHVEPGPLLDIGCSYGYALQAARSLGLEAVGTDVSEYTISECRKLGFRAEPGTMDALPFQDGEFQIVTMKHVLEHTPDPRRALAEVRRVLRARGALFIAIPDARYNKAARAPLESGYYRPTKHGNEHYVYYTPTTLARLLDECGFDVVRVNPHLLQRHAPPIRRVAQVLLAPLRAVGQWLADMLRIRKEFWLVALKR